MLFESFTIWKFYFFKNQLKYTNKNNRVTYKYIQEEKKIQLAFTHETGKISIHIWDRKGRGIGQRDEYDKGQ